MVLRETIHNPPSLKTSDLPSKCANNKIQHRIRSPKSEIESRRRKDTSTHIPRPHIQPSQDLLQQQTQPLSHHPQTSQTSPHRQPISKPPNPQKLPPTSPFQSQSPSQSQSQHQSYHENPPQPQYSYQIPPPKQPRRTSTLATSNSQPKVHVPTPKTPNPKPRLNLNPNPNPNP